MKLLKWVLGLVVLLWAAFMVCDYFFPEALVRTALNAERGAAGLQRKEVDIPGAKVVYLEGGQGQPLLLVHGFNGDKDNWTRVSKYLTAHYHVYAMDLPCWGESTRLTAADCDIEQQVAHLDQFASALKLEHFDLGGNSMGGWIAAAYGAAHRDKVNSLWLLAPAGVGSAEPSDLLKIVKSGARMPLIARDAQQMDELLHFVCVHPPFIPHALLVEMAKRQDEHVALEQAIFAELQNKRALEEDVKDLPTPAFIVWGDHDRALHYSGAEILHKQMPNSKVLIMPDMGHVPMLETPKQAAQDYIAYRESLGKT